jgi:Zn finger protein HypA/HybF involved in hydrogenase expression
MMKKKPRKNKKWMKYQLGKAPKHVCKRCSKPFKSNKYRYYCSRCRYMVEAKNHNNVVFGSDMHWLESTSFSEA